MGHISTPEYVIGRMLTLAQVSPADIIYDLGCGSGHLIVGAALAGAGRVVGIDIDVNSIEAARWNATSAGVADRVTLIHGDIFDVALTDATIIMMYLGPEIPPLRLREKLLKELRPGTRIVSYSFGLGDWKPNHIERKKGSSVYLWTVPESQVSLEKWERSSDVPVYFTWQDLHDDGFVLVPRLNGSPLPGLHRTSDNRTMHAQVAPSCARATATVLAELENRTDCTAACINLSWCFHDASRSRVSRLLLAIPMGEGLLPINLARADARTPQGPLLPNQTYYIRDPAGFCESRLRDATWTYGSLCLDSVILDSGLLVGEDLFDIAQRFRAQLRLKRHLVELLGGATSSEIDWDRVIRSLSVDDSRPLPVDSGKHGPRGSGDAFDERWWIVQIDAWLRCDPNSEHYEQKATRLSTWLRMPPFHLSTEEIV